ncbi:carboxypeptidase S1-like protein B [Didymella exigua CBS 183.55]|uniref:Carboxypeptidase S1-like protein B n=1 Tax=Didymella exigua CBS 183.55 TaxID=1150837 RepID=A0A6A5R740_9PLEO|nr:carboxypeptidase S1-like protein B [Didymella exigua CBS 183.55]KAF1923975.1 carboxypeptidase S1-like protein B [Didymella exigua CBS 183.55]
MAASIAILLGLAVSAVAQFPPEPVGVKVLQSRFGEGVTISYKENDLCETTPGVRSYSGHVYLPPGTADLGQGQDYPMNTFFWFFEARNDPSNAPTTIWLNGGPGSSSMYGLLEENGPCYANPDSNSTHLSEWSWNNESNMLYLDQPTQVGFSYDTLQNVTRNLLTGEVTLLNATDPVPEQNTTFLTGTFPSRDPNNTAFGSVNGAVAAWHFTQAWFQEFPHLLPNDTRLSLAAQSYGGRYGPAMFRVFEEQNQRIENGTWDGGEGEQFILHLDTLLMISGCIDRYVQYPYYPQQAFRDNGYGIEAVNETVYNSMVEAVPECLQQIQLCRDEAAVSDPENLGINATVNSYCEDAETFCRTNIVSPYTQYSGLDYYDISTQSPPPFPPPFHEGFLNQPWVQSEMGVPLNWTGNSPQASGAYREIGDYPRDSWLDDLAFLLDNGIKVSLVHGDLDFACPWASGDAVAKAINWTGSAGYAAAQYAEIQTNDSYVGGLVRQHGNLSYIRTYQAGHAIPSYQPETAYKIFTRALFNLDIATGTVSSAGNYTSTGRDDPNVQLIATPQDLTYCYTWNIGGCYEWQQDAIANGTAEICNYIFVDANSTKLFPEVIAKCRGESHDGTSSGNNSLPVPEFEGSAGTLTSGGLFSTSIIGLVVLAFVI